MLRLHLASSSPRRAELLRSLGFQFTQGGADIDERRLAAESCRDLVIRLATGKARAGFSEGLIVVGADTEVILGDDAFGKPGNRADGIAMLQRLSGISHQVMTGVAVFNGETLHTALSVTDVRFRRIDPVEAAAYWETGEPADKAGGYGIQGRGGVFVESIRGSYSGVMGLPVFETAALLEKVGIRVMPGKNE